MTNADKVELMGLLKNATEMKKVAEDATRAYHDEKIAEFATAAIADLVDTRKAIMDMIRQNMAVLLPLDEMPLGYGICRPRVEDGEPDSINLGDGLKLVYRIHKEGKWEIKHGGRNGGDCYSVKPEEVELLYPWLDVHEKDHKGNRNPDYEIARLSSYQKEVVPEATNLKGVATAKTWNNIYNYAAITQKQTALLVKYFKAAVLEKTAQYKGKANQMEGYKANNQDVPKYEKAGF